MNNQNEETKDKNIATEETKPFLKRGWGFKIPFFKTRLNLPFFKKKINGRELKEDSPLLFYIRDDGETEVYTNVTTGKMIPKDKWGRKKDYENKIESRKLQHLNYNGERIPCYFHYEKEYYGYPHEAKMDAESYTKDLRIVISNYKEYDEKDANMTREEIINYIYIGCAVIGIPIAAWYLGDILGMWQKLGWFGYAEGGLKIIGQEIVKNTTINPPPTILP